MGMIPPLDVDSIILKICNYLSDQLYQSLKNYFESMEKPRIIIKQFFENELLEAYLFRIHFIMNILRTRIKGNRQFYYAGNKKVILYYYKEYKRLEWRTILQTKMSRIDFWKIIININASTKKCQRENINGSKSTTSIGPQIFFQI